MTLFSLLSTILTHPLSVVGGTVLVLHLLTRKAFKFAPWVGATRSDIRRALRLADLHSEERFYDLGCGDGRVVFEAHRWGARATGVELTWPLYLVARLRQLLGGAWGAEIRRGDLFATSVGDADVVYVYGMPRALAEDVRPKLLKEMKAGSRVVTVDFPIQGLEPARVDDNPRYPKKIWLYQM